MAPAHMDYVAYYTQLDIEDYARLTGKYDTASASEVRTYVMENWFRHRTQGTGYSVSLSDYDIGTRFPQTIVELKEMFGALNVLYRPGFNIVIFTKEEIAVYFELTYRRYRT